MSIHGIYTPFVFTLLRTLLHRQKRYLQSFHTFPHSFRKTPGVGGAPVSNQKSVEGSSARPLLTTHNALLTSQPLKPPLQMAHPYLCTCKKGPAARETRYSPCAAS